jgi:hypothetical protein
MTEKPPQAFRQTIRKWLLAVIIYTAALVCAAVFFSEYTRGSRPGMVLSGALFFALTWLNFRSILPHKEQSETEKAKADTQE